MSTTPMMGLIEPVEGGSNDQWAILLDAIFALIDAHDHTTGKGVKVPSNALSIIGDVAMATHAFTGLSVAAFTEIALAAATGYEGLFVNSADANLYFRNKAGINVQLTSANTINVSLVGGIGGDYAAVSALLSYDDATRDYWLQQEGSPRPWAGLRTADIKLYQKAASIANFVALISPPALAAAYTITMPAALPASQVLVQMSAAGVLLASNTLAVNQSITLTTGGKIKHTLKVKPFSLGTIDVLDTTGAGVSHSVGVGGVSQAAGSTTYYRLPDLLSEQRLLALFVFSSDGAGGSGFSLLSYDETNTTMAGVAGATNISIGVVNATGLVPTTPTVVAGTVYVLKVISGANACIIKKLEFNYDTP